MLIIDDLKEVYVSPEEILKRVEVVGGSGDFANRERVSYYRVLSQIGDIIHCAKLIRDSHSGEWTDIYNESFTTKDIIQGVVRRIGYDIY